MRIEDPAVRENVDRNPPRLKVVFYATRKINYYIYTFSIQGSNKKFCYESNKRKKNWCAACTPRKKH